MVAFTNQGAPLSARMEADRSADSSAANAWCISPQVRFRTSETFNTRGELDPQRYRSARGAFVTNLISSRVSYSFTPRIYVQALVQYNDRADLWSSNVRFGWLNQANTGLFVVYNDTQGLADSTLLRADRSLTIKFSRLLDLLN